MQGLPRSEESHVLEPKGGRLYFVCRSSPPVPRARSGTAPRERRRGSPDRSPGGRGTSGSSSRGSLRFASRTSPAPPISSPFRPSPQRRVGCVMSRSMSTKIEVGRRGVVLEHVGEAQIERRLELAGGEDVGRLGHRRVRHPIDRAALLERERAERACCCRAGLPRHQGSRARDEPATSATIRTIRRVRDEGTRQDGESSISWRDPRCIIRRSARWPSWNPWGSWRKITPGEPSSRV